ncbi:MAG: hypothetical protein ACT4PM_02650 [Gemmatimonadales bacterium]
MGFSTSVGFSQLQSSIPGIRESMALWYALPVVDLDQGYLQVLADLSSDKRRFSVFNDSGNIIRTRDVVAPIGIFTRDARRLLGMRFTDAPEIVEYGWRWYKP